MLEGRTEAGRRRRPGRARAEVRADDAAVAPAPAAAGSVRFEVERGVAVLTLVRPEARNALTLGMIEALHAALDRIEGSPGVRLLLLRGEGGNLCAGADVKAFLRAVESGSPEEADHVLAREYALDLRLARLPIPFVTIAEGIAMGGGLGLAFGGYLVATSTSRFAMPEARLGFLPDVGATHELRARLGLARARYHAWTSEPFGGEEALRRGFADAFVDAPDVEDLAVSLGRAARGESGYRLKGSAEIAFLHARVAGGVPAFQGRWSRGPQRSPAPDFVERHFGLATRTDVQRSLERAARSAPDDAERDLASETLALLARRSPASIWAADLLLDLDYEHRAREARAAADGRARRGSGTGDDARHGAGAGDAGDHGAPDWLSSLREGLARAEVETGTLDDLERPEARALALAHEFLFATAMLRHPDFAAGVAAFRDRRGPEFPSASEPLGVHRALFGTPAGWDLLRHAARLARDPFWVDVARQELDWVSPPRRGGEGSASPRARWFADGTLNASLEAVDRWVERGRGGRVALLWEGDRVDADRRPLEQRSITYAELLREVQRCAAALRALGLERGDSLVLYMPNIIETWVTQIAAARIGVVYHPVFAGFAREELADRVHLMGARVLVTADGAFRKGEAVQYKRDFVDPALRDFVPVDRALALLQEALARHDADPDGALLERMRTALADKVTVEKTKLLALFARDLDEAAGGRGAARDGAGSRADGRGGEQPGALDSPEAIAARIGLGDLPLAEGIGRAARLLDAAGVETARRERPILRELETRLDREPCAVETVVVLRRLGTRDESSWVEGRDLSFDDFLARGEAAGADTGPERMGAEDPLFVMFTSGSTGKPKGLVHTHGGYLVRLPFLLRTLFGLTRDQTILAVADPGWITGQSFAGWGPLVYGMTSILAGFVPSEDRLWAAIERYRVNFLKTGVTAIRAAMGDDPEFVRSHDLSSLRHRGGESTLREIEEAIARRLRRLPPGPAGDAARRGLGRLALRTRAVWLARWRGRPQDWPDLFSEALLQTRGQGGDGSGGPETLLPEEEAAALREEVERAGRAAESDTTRYTSCSCAEPLDAAVQAWWETQIGPMMNCWWRTEDAAPETGAAPGAHPQTPDAAARPLPWADLAVFIIRDDDGSRVPPRRAAIGEKGTVFVRANPGIARGTWVRPGAGDWRSDPRFAEIYHAEIPGWHNTGDAAVANPDGTLTFLGRDDEVLNVSGHRVGTQEIEGAVRSHPAVANVAAIGIPAETRGDNPALFVRLREGHAPGGILDNQIREAVAEAKGSHVAPSADFIFYVRNLPTTKSGKILRRFLKYAAALDRDTLAAILARLADPGARAGLLAADRETLASLFPALPRQGRTLRLGSVATVDRMEVVVEVLEAVGRRRDLGPAVTGAGAAAAGGAAEGTERAPDLVYRPYAAAPDVTYALGRTDFRPGIDPLPEAQEAWAMVRDAFGRPVHGEPRRSLVRVIEPVPHRPEPNEVVVQNLFAGSTHNVLHALLADPVSPFTWHRKPYHVLGSGAVCRVVACGREVDRAGLFAPGQLAINFPASYRLLDPKVSEDAMHAGFEIQGFETPEGTLRPFDRVLATQLLPVPKGLTLEQAASFMLNLVTVYRALTRRLEVRRGRTLLVEGATGGTGTHAVDLGRLLGARVVGIVGGERRGRRVLERGAAAFLDRTDAALAGLFEPVPDDPAAWETWERAGAPLLEALRARNEGRLADAVVSFTGRPAFGRLVQLLAPGGRLAFFGAFLGYCLRFLGRETADGRRAVPAAVMLERAGLRPGMGVLVHYGAGTGAAPAGGGTGDDAVGLEAIRAAEERGARVVALTNTDAQSARLNRDPEIAKRLAGTVSLESLRRGARFEWPDRMPDYDRDPARYERYETFTLKPLASAVGRLLRGPGEQRGQPDIVFARGDEDTLAADLFMVRPFTGAVLYAEPRRRAYTLYAPQVWMRQRRACFPDFEIVGSHMGNPQQGREVIDWIAQGLVPIAPPRVFAADEAPRAFQEMHDNAASGAFVVHLSAPGSGLATEREVDEANGATFWDEKFVTVRVDALQAGAARADRGGPGAGRSEGGRPGGGTHLARLTLRGEGGRPPALHRDAIYQIGNAFRRLEGDPRIAAVILTGEGHVAFLAGQDLRQLYDEVQDLEEALRIARDAQRIFDGIEAFPRPVIAVADGVALGGGHELFACAHYRLAVRAPRVRLGQPEIGLGIIPGFAGTQRLTRLLIDRHGLERGVREALEMNLTGRHYEVDEALALGLVEEAVEANGLQRAADLVRRERPVLETARAARRAARAAWAAPVSLPAGFLEGDERLRLLLRQAADPAIGRGVPAIRLLEATLAGLREGFEAGCAREAELFASLVVDERFGRRGIRRFLERQEPPPLAPRRPVDLSEAGRREGSGGGPDEEGRR